MKIALGLHLLFVSVVSGLAYAGFLHHLLGPSIGSFDKVMHFLLVGGIAFWWTAGWNNPQVTVAGFRIPIALVVPLVLATGEETAQALSPHRTADIGDWLANVLGLVTFWWLARRRMQPSSEKSQAAADSQRIRE